MQQKLISANPIYLDPLSDYGAKRIFGTEASKRLLIDFLNALLEGKKVIRDIAYLNNERNAAIKDGRKVIFDLYCLSEEGEHFIIEIQRVLQKFIKSRILFYSSTGIFEQGQKGKEWNFDLNEVYAICLADFIFDESCPDQFIHRVKFIDEETREIFDNSLTFIYLELPKFAKTEDELKTRLDKWLFILNNLSHFTEIPLILRNDLIFEELFEVALLSNLNKEQMNAYQLALKDYRDYHNTINYAAEMAEIKGKAEEKMVIARKLLEENIALSIIQKVTDLSIEEILKLKNA